MRRALSDAAVDLEDIDYINAHGTGTPENDRIEYLAVKTSSGKRASAVPISSNKSMIRSYAVGGSAIEAVVSLLAMQNGVLPRPSTT